MPRASDAFYVVFEPLTRWPLTDTASRKSPQFSASYDRTLHDLDGELRALDATGAAVLQVVTRHGGADLRRDGMLAQRAQIVHPGVRLSFTSRHGPITLATDEFEARWSHQPPSWQANLRAIVLGLEALRAVDRYGITRTGEQYRGWQQITSKLSPSAGMSRDVALAVLAEESGRVIEGPLTTGQPLWENVHSDVVKAAKRNAHPDRNNGDRRRWDALTQALDALGLAS